tara:strand:- start:497 stop:2851 length:2355 start_codon:yes stop_codon:yes gene_type:complete
MPEYGWAYVNLDALNSVNGATGSVTFRTSDTDISGTSAFIYATASHKVGLGINTPGASIVTALPSFILDVSASVGDVTAVRMVGDLQVTGSAHISGTLNVESLNANTVISSSNLIIRDPVIGMGFGDASGETGSVGDRGLVLGLAGNNNQAIIWDQTSGSFVIGKVGAVGADASAFDIPDANLSTVRVSDLTASNSVSASVFYGNGEHLTGIAASAVTSYTNPANNRIITSVDSSTINAEQKLTFDGSKLLVDASISGSDTLQAVGDTTLGGKLNVSSSVVFASSVSGSSTLEMVGDTFLGSNLNVTGTIKAPNIGAGTDNSVVILNSSGFLKTDEADGRIFGSTLVGNTGSPANNQLAIFTDSTTVEGSSKVTFNGSLLAIDAAISGSGTFESVGDATFGGKLNVTSSARFASSISGSSTLEIVGNTILGGDVNISGTLKAAGDVNVARKIIHDGDADTFIDFTTDDINFTVGNVNFLDLTEDTQNEITINETGVDIDFRVEGTSEQGLLYTDASANLVGIRSRTPTAVLHLSESGASVVGMPKPMLRIDHPGDASGKEFTEALFFVTGSVPDDYFEAHVGINTKQPQGALHVKSKEGGETFIVRDDKVAIGTNTAASKFHVQKSINSAADRDIVRVNVKLEDDTKRNSFYVTGSTDGTAVFGSFNTGSVLAVSGSSFMTSMHVQYSGTNQDTNVGPRDYIFGVDTSGGSPKIFLESAAVAGKGRKIVVKDTANNAGSNNIKITGSTVGDLIEFSNETLITDNKGSKTLVSDGVSKWFVIGKN